MPDIIIITTGDELLFGTTTDTNSSYMSEYFFGTDYRVRKHITVSDSIDDIESAVRQSISEADIVITTGGLGPTDDDNTVEAICRITGSIPVVEPSHREKMISFFSSMHTPINDCDNKMVSYPEGSIFLVNTKGLAPGFIVEKDNKIIISMPGVPAEMKKIFDSGVKEYIVNKYGIRNNRKLTYKISGIRESDINGIINGIVSGFNVKVSITPKSGICDLIIVPSTDDFSFAGDLSDSIKKAFKDYILEDGMASPEQELTALLKRNSLTMSTAESCTGGLVAKRITDIPGSSDVFTGSIVAYSNDVKVKVLGVKADTLAFHGAVSEQTAEEMVYGLHSVTGSDICVSVTGIAGPGGGTEEKPVGTVCFGFLIQNRFSTTTKKFSGSRERVRNFASLYVLNRIRKELKKDFLIEKN